MKTFTVEAIAAPVASESDFETLRHLTDLVPGTFLLEDPVEPTLVMPVEAPDMVSAAKFVRGLSLVTGVEFTGLNIAPAPSDEDGLDFEEDEPVTSPVSEALKLYAFA